MTFECVSCGKSKHERYKGYDMAGGTICVSATCTARVLRVKAELDEYDTPECYKND